MKKTSLLTVIGLSLILLSSLSAQNGTSVVEMPPKNPHLPDSPWPTYHRNNYRQASTQYPGPVNATEYEIKVLKGIKGGTSCWTNLTDTYPDGQRLLLLSNSTHVYKVADDDKGLRIVAKQRIDKDWLKSFGWNYLQGKDHSWFTYDPKYDPKKKEYTRLFRLEDAVRNDPYSDIVVKDTFNFGKYDINKVQHYGMNYSGQIVFASDNDKGKNPCTVGIISQEFELLASMQIEPIGNDEIFGHNAFPIDEHNSFYLVTTKRLLRVDWDGEELSIGWEAFYDFVGDGPTGKFAEGSGTTPTLMGVGEGNDKLVVLADGHSLNNLLAFWREVPEDWKGIPGADRRLAGKIKLPAAKRFSDTFQSIENSPSVMGYDVAIAQFNGFLGQGNNTMKGVQKIHWNTEKNVFELSWVNTDINMNGILTISSGSNMVYGSGREDKCSYYYYGLDWDTGELKFRKHLGKACRKLFNPYDDGGNNNVIDDKGNIYFSGGGSVIKLQSKL
ncbi:hypothetical protein FGM00_16160 [Aggregatimonas sangjinii]|uniref:Uncharacterized protein n=1 Tax=Aggregatimonas sangjinii TaxID=2583587 RepID=A0A5B7SSR2_9FLAO|nr:hypothetical protein [Aggregatimonas sangjinii]QCX01567.1 hypothetical protein FGM00_16160 [Aggregatimonas sangjinii]